MTNHKDPLIEQAQKLCDLLYAHHVIKYDAALSRPQPAPASEPGERAAIVAWLLQQSDQGADIALAQDKGTTARASYGGGSYALKRVAEMIEAGEHLSTPANQSDHIADASKMVEALREALRIFVGAAYPVDTCIAARGYNWSEAYLDQALIIARAALTAQAHPAEDDRLDRRETELMGVISGLDQMNIILADLVRRAMRLIPEGKSLWWDEAKGAIELLDRAQALDAMRPVHPAVEGEAVGVAGEMPGSNGGFSMVVFKASDVPIGTPLYAHATPASDVREAVNCYSLSVINGREVTARFDDPADGLALFNELKARSGCTGPSLSTPPAETSGVS